MGDSMRRLRDCLNSLDKIWQKNQQKYEKPKPFKPLDKEEGRTLVDLFASKDVPHRDRAKSAVDAMNCLLETDYKQNCLEVGLSAPILNIENGSLTLTKKALGKLTKAREGWKQGDMLGSMLLRSRADLTIQPAVQTLRWYWDSLPLLGDGPSNQDPNPQNYKVLVCWSRAFKQKMMQSLAFDEIYFPRNVKLLAHYLKTHLRHRLVDNLCNPESRSIAWFGSRPEHDGVEQKKPEAILWNTGLRLKSDWKQHLLVLCTRQTKPDSKATAPWFFSRVIYEGEIGQGKDMRAHLLPAMAASQADVQNCRFEFPLWENGKRHMPEPQHVRREFLTFDRHAKVEFGAFYKHVQDQSVRQRLPDELLELLEGESDALRNRVDFAIERARVCPNTVLSQWYCDKGALQGTPQLIAPLSWRSPPALDVHAGLVLDIELHDDSQESSSDTDTQSLQVSYVARTILPLDFVFSNVFVLWPLGGHWLTAAHERVRASEWLKHHEEEEEGDGLALADDEQVVEQELYPEEPELLAMAG